MKVTRNTPDQLVLDAKPAMLALFLGVFILAWFYVSFKIIAAGDNAGYLFMSAVVVPLLFLSFAERQSVTLDRTAGTITFDRRNVYRKTVITHELFTVKFARMRWNKPRRRAKLFIHCETGPVESGLFARRDTAKAASKAVNDWLKAYRKHAKQTA